MFNDPTNTLSVSLLPHWAFDPFHSSLTRLTFVDWTAPKARQLFVDLELFPVDAAKTDDEWEEAVRSMVAVLPNKPTRAERRRGPVFLAEFPACEKLPDRRMAWIRGPRRGVVIEQDGVSLGGSLLTPDINEAFLNLNVPVNYRIGKDSHKIDWDQAMEKANQSFKAGDTDKAGQFLAQAIEAARGIWLPSLIGQGVADIFHLIQFQTVDRNWLANLIRSKVKVPDIPAAIDLSEALLQASALTDSTSLLEDATTTLYRCRGSLHYFRLEGTPVSHRVDVLIKQALLLHGRLQDSPPPIDPVSASKVRCQLFLKEFADKSNSYNSTQNHCHWRELANLAALANANALVTLAQSRLVVGIRYSDLTPEVREAVGAYGITDDASLKKGHEQQELELLDLAALAGKATCQVPSASSVSAVALRSNSLLAARQAAKLGPSETRYKILVELLDGYAGSLTELGDEPSLHEAENAMAEAQTILDQLGDEGELRSMVCANQAAILSRQDRFPEALSKIDRATAIANTTHWNSGLSHCIRASILDRMGNHNEAIEEAGHAVHMISNDKLSVVHSTLAKIHQHSGNIVSALEEIRTGLAAAFPYDPIGDAVEDLMETATQIKDEKSELSLAVTEAAELLSDVRRLDVGGDPERIAFDDSVERRDLGATLVRRRLEFNDLLGAFATADRHRTVLLAEAGGLGSSPGDAYDFDADNKYPPAEASLLDQIAFLTARARAFLTSRGIPPPLGRSALETLITNHGRAIILIQPYHKEILLFVAKSGPPLTIETVTATRSACEIAELAEGLRKELAISLATRSARGELPRQSIEELETSFIDEADEEIDLNLDRLRRDLHDALFSNVCSLLRDQEPIALVPYRELAVIPFAILVDAEGRTLGERHPISILPSLSSLVSTITTDNRAHAVVVGDPKLPSDTGFSSLKGAAAEAEQITQMLANAGIDTKQLIGPQATEAEFRANVDAARVVHLACHAALREPASASPLFLAPSRHDNGLLLPAEIADLHLNQALVVLSACESGLGRASADGIVGLGRAFMHAGAQTLVLSLWRVGDEVTSHLMCEFYRGLLGTGEDLDERLDVATAARRAQLLVRKKFSGHPSAWGAWLVVGDGGWRL